MRYAWLLMCLGGCQCLSPVNEFPLNDSGVVTDSGTNVVQLPACTKPSDCTADFKTTDWCTGDGGAEWSCVDQRCVPECQGHGDRTCVTDTTGCLKCPPTATCPTRDCNITRDVRWRLEQLSCVGPAPLAVGDVIHAVPNGTCGTALFLERDGGSTAFGQTYFQYTANDIHDLVDIEMLGGSCIALQVPTNVERVQFDCPRCQLVVANW